MRNVLGALILLPIFSWADTVEQRVYAECVEGQRIELVAFDSFDSSSEGRDRFGILQHRDPEHLKPHLYRERKLSCELAGRRIVVSFHMESPRERGECAGQPGGWISLFQDGKEILSSMMNNYCFQSLDALVIRSSGSSALEYMFCGDGLNTSLSFDGCLTLSQGQFDQLKLPLSSFPMSDLISAGRDAEP